MQLFFYISLIIAFFDFLFKCYGIIWVIRNNEEFNLSKIEAKILEYFLKNKNKTISIDEISVNNWVYDEMPESTTIRTYIKNLRKKLNDETITTLKGIGYRFNIR